MKGKLLAQLCNKALPEALGGCGGGGADQGITNIGRLIAALMGIFLVIAFIFAMLYLILGGLNWITAGGDKTKLQTARDKITQAIVGLIIVAAVYAIMILIGTFIGIDFPSIPVPTIG